MIRSFKRLISGLLVASVLVGGGLAFSEDASAYTKTHRSDDGKLVLICHYDDVTHELAFCDVHWFPLQATQGEVAQPDVAQPAITQTDVAAEGAVLAEYE
jgi:hypothetical protein